MKSTALLNALFASAALAAILPRDDDAPAVDIETEPYTNSVPLPVVGEDPLDFLNSDEGATSLESTSTAAAVLSGEEAWNQVIAEIAAEATAGQTAKRQEGKPSWWPTFGGGGGGRGNDFHHGITADAVCTYFRGAAWKARDLRRPVQQWEYENVPWLIQNQGPYIYVLDGLREIEWVFWRVERSLQYVSVFTEEEEWQIARCYYEFSGYERQLTTLPPGVPIVVRPASETSDLEERQVSGPGLIAPQPPAVFVPWIRRFGIKSLLRLIQGKANVSRFQTYANHRIVNVLENLRRSVLGASEGLQRKFQTPRVVEFLRYDLQPLQGISSAFNEVIIAYELNNA
ncbi:hypothetical protein Cob_v009224 [Colletotrichum orbiculare MAFF 240422]|uniref:Uncharacterized protein n=1 Tax=Colletotrichum orbiculare (strain 104-T / ATCC 96160 / CBS 514.97 / LARS 414 / MAFF 240422) TaxID=1213857 RepID=N4W2U5_COLOR|nr:hypothetical protein Cob_v009224 [Colletotrichum orbiculare MAFF 240422]